MNDGDENAVDALREDVLVARVAALEEALARAEAASAAKSAFLSSMSHELRTPLNAILGFAQLLRRDRHEPLSPRHRERVEQILRGGEHLIRLIDDILDLSRIEANGMAISIEAVDIHGVLGEVMHMLQGAADRAEVRLVVVPPGDAIEVVSVDRTRFIQILLNLGSNAVKYNRRGGRVTFAVSRPNPRHLRVTVTDTGVGIPADRQNALFRPFQRAGQEHGSIPGTGLGLALAKRLAELMDASIGFASEPHQGSEFWIEAQAHPSAIASIEELAPDVDDGGEQPR
jgi:signal transduction histidine kinase